MKPPEYPKNNSRSKGAGVTDISRLFDARTFLEARKIWVACRRINFTHWISKLMRAGFRLQGRERGEANLDREDLVEIMARYTDYLLRIAYGYVKDLHAAEDLVQEVFIKFYNNNGKYEERGELKAYLAKMTVNKSKDYLRSWNYRKVQLKTSLLLHAGKRNADGLVKKDEQELIGEAILNLPLKQREVLVHFYYNEMTLAEIADVISIPLSTVKTRLTRGRELLRNQLQGFEWEVLNHE